MNDALELIVSPDRDAPIHQGSACVWVQLVSCYQRRQTHGHEDPAAELIFHPNNGKNSDQKQLQQLQNTWSGKGAAVRGSMCLFLTFRSGCMNQI